MSRISGWLAALLILVPSLSSGCLLSWRASHGATFEGLYTSSFEVSSFVPCEMREEPGYGSGYWLSALPGAGFFEQYDALAAEVITDTSPLGSPGVIVYTRFVGDLSPARTSPFGGYGHLDAYTRQITVTEVLEMTLENQCMH